MKYFTPELLARLRSPDEDVSAKAHADWERAIVRYHRRLKRIESQLPPSVRRFRQQLCLHDAQLLAMVRQNQTFFMVLELEPPAPDLALLSFHLAEDPVIDQTALPGRSSSNFVTWMYEEFNVRGDQTSTMEVLLSNGWVVKLLFHQLKFVIGHNLLPGGDGALKPLRSVVLPRTG